MLIEVIPSYQEVLSLLANVPHLLILSICCVEFDEKFFVDLSEILKNLIDLKIHKLESDLESLNFLEGFKRLLAFGARFEDNEMNWKIIESIRERKKRLIYPVLANNLYFYDRLICSRYPS